jgi:DNA-binding CsgD family transcriptional regulator/transcriptional regulator with XRE-family HTH domain
MNHRLQPYSPPPINEAAGGVNAALRAARRAAGLSLDVLAARTNFSKSYLGNVEAGRRRVTPEIAAAYDAAVGTGDLLRRMLADAPERLVGRATELSTLRRLVVELMAGRGRAVWLEGEPGIGKSALLSAGLAGALTAGCQVLRAAADESLARFPLWVLLESAHGDPDPEWAAIRGLLRGTGTPMAGDPVAAAAERFVLLIEQRCAVAPVLLVVDDLQWADEVSLSVWGRLRRLVSQVPLLLVAACRPVPRRPAVAALRRGVTGSDAAVLSLGPLAAAQVTELTAWVAGAPAGPRLRAAVDQAGGNPLYLHEMVEALVREERVRIVAGTAELSGSPVLPSLAAAIGARLGFLSEPVRAVLRIAALLGPEPTVADLSVVDGRSAVELAGVMDEAVTAGVLLPRADRMAFRHGLIRDALREQTPPAVRVALHRQAARALAEAGAAVEVVAEQLLAGGDQAAGAWVVDWLSGGAATALVSRAPQAALELIDRVPERSRATLAGYRVGALSLLGRDEEVAKAAPAVLADSTDPQIVGRTAWTLAYSLGRLARRSEARAVLAEVLRTHEFDRVWRARLYAGDAIASVDRATCHRALAEAERVGDRFAAGYALHALSVSYQHQDPDEKETLAAIDRALAVIGDHSETADLRVMLLGNRVLCLTNLGRSAEVPAAIGAAFAAAERVGTLTRQVFVHGMAAATNYELGRWDDALAELAGLATLDDGGSPLNRWRSWGIRALIAVHRDDSDALPFSVGDRGDPDSPEVGAEDLTGTSGLLRIARAYALEAAGRPEEALAAALVACVGPGSSPLAVEIALSCQLEIPEVVRMAVAFGRRAEAEAFTRAAVARADGRATGPDGEPVARHCEGLLLGDPDLVAAAADGYERATRPLYRGHALENLAVLLAGRGDLTAARAPYDAAAEIYVGLEAAWDLRRAEGRLRPFGLRRNRYRVRRRPATGADALTPTERTVAEMVAQGLSNPDIAARLNVSRRTVESHVAHLLIKLDARSRAEVARHVGAPP